MAVGVTNSASANSVNNVAANFSRSTEQFLEFPENRVDCHSNYGTPEHRQDERFDDVIGP